MRTLDCETVSISISSRSSSSSSSSSRSKSSSSSSSSSSSTRSRDCNIRRLGFADIWTLGDCDMRRWGYAQGAIFGDWEIAIFGNWEIGFKVGLVSPYCFHRESDGASCVVHGDDSTFEGIDANLAKILEELLRHWLVNVRGIMGPEPMDDKEIAILGRVVRWCEDWICFEADPRQVEKLLGNLSMDSCRLVAVPSV